MATFDLTRLVQESIFKDLGKERKAELAAMPYKEYLHSPEWRAIRQYVLSIFPTCQVCHTSVELELHHNNYPPRGEETLRDLCVVCDSCHEAITAFLSPSEESWADAPGAWMQNISQRIDAANLLYDEATSTLEQNLIGVLKGYLEGAIHSST